MELTRETQPREEGPSEPSDCVTHGPDDSRSWEENCGREEGSGIVAKAITAVLPFLVRFEWQGKRKDRGERVI